MNNERLQQIIDHLDQNVTEEQFDIDDVKKCVMGHSYHFRKDLDPFPTLDGWLNVSENELKTFHHITGGCHSEFPTKQSAIDYLRKEFLCS